MLNTCLGDNPRLVENEMMGDVYNFGTIFSIRVSFCINYIYIKKKTKFMYKCASTIFSYDKCLRVVIKLRI